MPAVPAVAAPLVVAVLVLAVAAVLAALAVLEAVALAATPASEDMGLAASELLQVLPTLQTFSMEAALTMVPPVQEAFFHTGIHIFGPIMVTQHQESGRPQPAHRGLRPVRKRHFRQGTGITARIRRPTTPT